MKKILFVTNRNILTTCGELRLIKNRAEALYNIYSVTTDFIVLSSESRIRATNREKISAGGSLEVFPISRTNFLKSVKEFIHLQTFVIQKAIHEKYDSIVLSGLLMSIMAKRLKRTGISVVLDIHGALEDTRVAVSDSGFVKKNIFNILYILESMTLNRAFNYASGCFVVTKALKKYLIERFPAAKNTKFYTVPCSTSSSEMNSEDYSIYREEYRKKYGITNEKVFIYSGGTSVWQCVEETIELYKNLCGKLKQPSKLLIFSHDIENIRAMIGEEKNIILDSYQPIELEKALCAADIAFLLRKKCPTNRVAFPNKFLEYVKSGLYVIATPNVEEIAAQIRKYKVGALYNMDKQIMALTNDIQSYVNSSYDQEKIKEILYYNGFEKRLKTFVDE